jgi:hypothetical protein
MKEKHTLFRHDMFMMILLVNENTLSGGKKDSRVDVKSSDKDFRGKQTLTFLVIELISLLK